MILFYKKSDGRTLPTFFNPHFLQNLCTAATVWPINKLQFCTGLATKTLVEVWRKNAYNAYMLNKM